MGLTGRGYGGLSGGGGLDVGRKGPDDEEIDELR